MRNARQRGTAGMLLALGMAVLTLVSCAGPVANSTAQGQSGASVLSMPALPEIPNDEAPKTMVYKNVGETALELDMYRPPGPQRPSPLLVVFHGGGWTSGTRHDIDMQGFLQETRDKGFVVVLADYRLVSMEVFYPLPVVDACDAVRYLVANSEELNIDTSRVFTMGYSAGGHLALLAGLVPQKYPSDVAELANVEYIVRGCVSVSAPYDLKEMMDLAVEAVKNGTSDWRQGGLLVGALLGVQALSGVDDLAKEASPISHIRTKSNPQMRLWMVHGTEDELIPVAQATRFFDLAQNNEYTAKLYAIDGVKHLLNSAGNQQAQKQLDAATKEISKQLLATR